jgi:hypothetical protein
MDGADTRYLIKSQNDLYQISELVKFFTLFSLGEFIVLFLQLCGTLGCIVMSYVAYPITWLMSPKSDRATVNTGNQQQDVQPYNKKHEAFLPETYADVLKHGTVEDTVKKEFGFGSEQMPSGKNAAMPAQPE